MSKILSYESRRKLWLRTPREGRKFIIQGSAAHLLDDNSIECTIQMLIDMFGCDHQEVIEALKELGE